MTEENPKCLFSSQGIDCYTECDLLPKAADRMKLNARLSIAMLLSLRARGVELSPEELKDQEMTGLQYATTHRAFLSECRNYQEKVQGTNQ